MEEINKIVLKALSDIACNNTGSCQINLQSESAQIMVANRISEELDPYVKDLIERIICGQRFDILGDQKDG